jgi:hypothetical protein
MGPIFNVQEIQERLLDPLIRNDFLPLKVEGLLTLGDGSERFFRKVGTELQLSTT